MAGPAEVQDRQGAQERGEGPVAQSIRTGGSVSPDASILALSHTHCALCYNESGISSSQAVCSARPALRWLFHHLITSRLRFFLRLHSFPCLKEIQPCRFPHPTLAALCLS